VHSYFAEIAAGLAAGSASLQADAALGVFGTGTGWPDVLVAAIMASLALQGAFIVIRQAWIELQSPRRSIAFPAE
jgi:Co/Zn/Cd efflux system component